MSGAFDRRSVLLGGAGLVTVATLADCQKAPVEAKDAGVTEPSGSEPGGKEMSQADIVPVLVAIADRLIPSDDLGPGVKDAGAEQYFTKVLADPRMRAIKSLVTRGAVWVHKAARKEIGVAFTEAPVASRDDLIRRLAENQVRPNGFSPATFVKVMIALSLEAFLGDPRHGGNRDQIGWKFAGGIDWAGRSKLPTPLPVLPGSKP
jgi:gluconate 2-dehydrogenase gamma chain